ncbi:SPOR domain-containing protein, partial [Herbaspirillum sp.]|uniref:SPOR domain-containing protein n=1 Tax=Herbaspirillum sp. TaxID=1890675 RepID=UPI0031CE7AF6
SEPKSLNDDIAIQIPSKDQPAANAGNAAASAAQPAGDKLASAASTLDQKEEIVEPAAVSPAPAAAPASAPAVAAPPAVAPVTPPKPAEKPAAKPEEKKPAAAERKEEPKKEAPKKDAPKPKAVEQGDDSRALAILEGKSTADKKPAATGGKFVIQVAALATQDKINELRSKLSSAGIHSFTQKIATQAGDRTRIRVGPFASRDEAEKMGARIKKLGLNATIVPA